MEETRIVEAVQHPLLQLRQLSDGRTWSSMRRAALIRWCRYEPDRTVRSPRRATTSCNNHANLLPAVPLTLGRARFCISAAHTREDLDDALAKIEEVAKKCNCRYKTHVMG